MRRRNTSGAYFFHAAVGSLGSAAWLRRKVQALERVRLRSRGLTRKGKERGDLKLHKLIQAKKRAPSTPTPPNGSRKARLPDSVLFPPHCPPLSGLRGAASKDTKTRRASPDTRKTHDQPIQTAGVPLPLEDPLSPERHSRLYTHPSRGNRQDSLSEFLASFCSL